MSEPTIIKGKVAAIINKYSVIINRGAKDGVQEEDKFDIYPKGSIATIKDPDNPDRQITLKLYVPRIIVERVMDDYFSFCSTERSLDLGTPFGFAYLSEKLESSKPLREQVEPVKVGDPVEQVVEPFKIIKAVYGIENKTIDVTTQLKNQIKENRLIATVSNKIAGDPAPGLNKKLRIEYRVYGKNHTEEYDENTQFDIPKK